MTDGTGQALPESVDAARLDAMDEDELLFHLGRATVGDALVPQGFDTLIARGRHVLHELAPKARHLLCDADGPRAVLKELSGDALRGGIVALLAGAVTGLSTLALTYVAAVLVRRGLEHYCALPAASPPSTPG